MFIIDLFLGVSFIAYCFQIGFFIIATFSGVKDAFDTKWEYLLSLVPFAFWYFLFKKIYSNLSEF